MEDNMEALDDHDSLIAPENNLNDYQAQVRTYLSCEAFGAKRDASRSK